VILIVLVVAVSWTACAPQRRATDPLRWDFERDAHRGALAGAAAGSYIGELLGGAIGAAVSVGGMINDGIPLTPTELNRIVSEALAPALERVPATARSLMPTPVASAGAPWTVAESNQGQFTTDWRPIRGRTAGVLWWKKTYESEVHHVITIMPSYRSPALANLSVITEVRERPNAQYPWVAGDAELGRPSFESLKNMLLATIRATIDQKKDKR
jgi:hypothetical protein